MEENTKKIDVKVKLEESDYLLFNKEYIKLSNKLKKISRLFKWGCLTYLLLFIFILVVFQLMPPADEAANSTAVTSNSFHFTPIIFIILIILFSAVVIPYLNNKNAKKHFNSNKLLQQENEICFTDEYILIKSENTNNKFSWDMLFKIFETNSAFGVFISNATFFLIPKRFFDTNDNINALKNLFESKLPSSKIQTYKKNKKNRQIF